MNIPVLSLRVTPRGMRQPHLSQSRTNYESGPVRQSLCRNSISLMHLILLPSIVLRRFSASHYCYADTFPLYTDSGSLYQMEMQNAPKMRKESEMNIRKMSFLMVFFALSMYVITCPSLSVAQETRLIIRGDDMGMTQGSLVAFERALNRGVLTSASIIVPGPWFEGAAELCRKNPGWCTGVHLCLVGEWRGFRWRPVLPYDKVPSMVDEDGFLYTYPDELFAKKPKLSEIEAELRAQIELAIKKGVNVQYIDTHYLSPGNTGYPGLNEIIKKLGNEYKVPVSGLMNEKRLSIYSVPVEQKLNQAVEMLQGLESGLYLWVCHPGIDSPEQNALIHTALSDIFIEGGVGKHRAEVLNTLTSLEVKSVILSRQIKLTTYRDLSER